MHLKQIRLSASLAVAALLLSSCGLIGPFGEAVAALCDQDILVVNKTDDSNDGACSPEDCSLREAVITANGCPGPDTIRLSPATYVLTRGGANEDGAVTGDLDITDDLVFQGHGAVIDGNGSDRVFDILPGPGGEVIEVSMLDLAIQNGRADEGSAVRNQGTWNAARVNIHNNYTEREGAILNEGTATVQGEITNNIGSERSRAAVVNQGSMTIEDSQISGNHIQQVYADEPAYSYGVANEGEMSISRTTIAANNDENDRGYGVGDGHGLTDTTHLIMDSVLIEDHSWSGLASLTEGSHVEARDSTIRNNAHGALNIWGQASLERVTISGNGAASEIGPDTCSVIVVSGTLSLLNSTISNNTGADGCSVIRNFSDLELRFVTLFENNLAGIVNDPSSAYATTASLGGTLLGLNASQNCQGPGITSTGFNVADDTSCPFGPDDQALPGTDLMLAPLADNGGETLTRALLPGSPAVDMGGTECPAGDQRSTARPQGPTCDTGAFELEGGSPPTPEPLSSDLPPQVKIMRDTLCFAGPGAPHPVVGAVLQGSSASVRGIGALDDWLVIESPRRPGVICWVKRADVEEPNALDTSVLKIFAVPPLPTATPEPRRGVGCLVENPNNPKELICVPRSCTPNDQPGGHCTP